MYKITYVHKDQNIEKPLYIPGDRDYCLTTAQLSLSMGTSGKLKLYIPNDNPAKSDIDCLTDEIIVYRNDEEIWRGRPVTSRTDFDLTGRLTCEGILSYLYDTYYPPFEFEGSPNDLLQSVIDNHNSQVEERKQFKLGRVTVEDSNNYIHRSSIYYNRSITVLQEKFVEDSLGGYFRVRVEDGVKYLDYLTTYETESSQPVQYGYNLLNIAQDIEYSDVASVILPLGAKLKDEDGLETDERLTIESVNNGSIYIEDPAAVERFGWIAVSVTWDDVTLPENLYQKGYDYLTQVTSPISSFSVKAVDLSLADSEVDPINLGDFVLIRVDAFGMNQMVELTGMNIDMLDPSNSMLEFGTDAATLTGSTSNTQRSIQESIGSLSMRVTNLSADVINAVYANIETIIAGTITTDFIRAAVADLGYVTADWVEANFADVGYLEATYATILDLDAVSGSITLLDSDVANILNVLAGNVGTGDLQTIILTADNAIIDEAVIVNALMDTVLASVLSAGVIYTDYIKIADNEGQYLWVDGSTLQFKDENGIVRVQIGLDGEGNYNYYLWDKNGVLIWNPLGLTEEGLTGNGAIIKDEAVADDANISGYKLNIQEVAQILNETGDLVLNATQVIIDGQTLDYQLTQITQQIEGLEMEGVISIENWYSLGTKDAPYTDPEDSTIDPATSSILGEMVLGESVLGSDGEHYTSWTTTQPTTGEDEYLWFAQKVTYVDGTTAWTTPTLLTDYYTRNAVNVQQTELEVIQGQITEKIWMTDIEDSADKLKSTISEQYGQLTVLIDAVDARVGILTTTVGDYYEELKSSITAITLDTDGIKEEIRSVYEWATDSFSEMSEQYAQVVISLDGISQEVVNVQTDLTHNYSTTTAVSSMIDQSVIASRAEILEEVSYSYVSNDTLGNYYTSTETDALISAWADETSSGILQIVSATYATQDYVSDVLDGLDMDAVTNIETYYCVSGSGTGTPDYTIYTSDDTFDGWNRWTSETDADGTYEIVTDSTLGTCIRLVTTSEKGYLGARYTLGTNFEPGTYRVSFKAATETGYEQTARWRIGLGGNNYMAYSGKSGQLTSGQWTERIQDCSLSSIETSGTFYIRVMGYDQNVPTLYKDISIESIADWSTEYPTVKTGQYVWVRYFVTYVDGHTEWTEPFCTTSDLSDYPTVTAMNATISQYVDESMASIGLVVSSQVTKTILSIPQGSESLYKLETLSGSGSQGFGIFNSTFGYTYQINAAASDYVVGFKIDEDLGAGTYLINMKIGTTPAYDGEEIYLEVGIGDRRSAVSLDLESDYLSSIRFEVHVSGDVDDYVTFRLGTTGVEFLFTNITVTWEVGAGTNTLGSFAGIYLTVGGQEVAGGELDLRKVREAFANDTSSITIAAGTVSFLSNTLIIASKCLELDGDGNATFSGSLSAPSGNIGGWTIGTSSLYNGTSSLTSTTNGTYLGTDGIRQYNSGNYMNITSAVIRNGNSSNDYVELYSGSLRFYNEGTNLGYYGTTYWKGTTQYGLVINTEYENNFIVFGRKTSSSADAYTAAYLINYNLGSSTLGYSERHIFYGSARFTGSVSGISAASVTVEGNVYNTGDYYSASDTKVKVDVNDMLDKVDTDDIIDKLEPVTYRLKDYDDGKTHIGLTYQNLKSAIEAEGLNADDMAILSSIKDRDGEEIGMIAYSELIPILIGEIKELKDKVNKL